MQCQDLSLVELCCLHLNIYGNRIYISRFLANILASLYVGSFVLFTKGLIGDSALYTLIKPLLVGEEGLIFTYFHFTSLYIIWGHSMLFLSSFRNFFERSPFMLIKLLLLLLLLVVVVVDDDELHHFLMACILIGIDNALAFICFGNYSIVANERFFDLVQDFLFFFIKKCFVLFCIICSLVSHILLFRCG